MSETIVRPVSPLAAPHLDTPARTLWPSIPSPLACFSPDQAQLLEKPARVARRCLMHLILLLARAPDAAALHALRQPLFTSLAHLLSAL